MGNIRGIYGCGCYKALVEEFVGGLGASPSRASRPSSMAQAL